MGLNNRREELPSPDDDGSKEPKTPKKKGRGSDAASALREAMRRNIIAKLHRPLDFPHLTWTDQGNETGFRVLLCFLLGMSHPEYPLLKVRLCDNGRVVGKVHTSGRDIALPEALEPFVGLCGIDYAVTTICDLADRYGFTLAERGFLLNGLPKWPAQMQDVQ